MMMVKRSGMLNLCYCEICGVNWSIWWLLFDIVFNVGMIIFFLNIFGIKKIIGISIINIRDGKLNNYGLWIFFLVKILELYFV